MVESIWIVAHADEHIQDNTCNFVSSMVSVEGSPLECLRCVKLIRLCIYYSGDHFNELGNCYLNVNLSHCVVSKRVHLRCETETKSFSL